MHTQVPHHKDYRGVSDILEARYVSCVVCTVVASQAEVTWLSEVTPPPEHTGDIAPHAYSAEPPSTVTNDAIKGVASKAHNSQARRVKARKEIQQGVQKLLEWRQEYEDLEYTLTPSALQGLGRCLHNAWGVGDVAFIPEARLRRLAAEGKIVGSHQRLNEADALLVKSLPPACSIMQGGGGEEEQQGPDGMLACRVAYIVGFHTSSRVCWQAGPVSEQLQSVVHSPCATGGMEIDEGVGGGGGGVTSVAAAAAAAGAAAAAAAAATAERAAAETEKREQISARVSLRGPPAASFALLIREPGPSDFHVGERVSRKPLRGGSDLFLMGCPFFVPSGWGAPTALTGGASVLYPVPLREKGDLNLTDFFPLIEGKVETLLDRSRALLELTVLYLCEYNPLGCIDPAIRERLSPICRHVDLYADYFRPPRDFDGLCVSHFRDALWRQTEAAMWSNQLFINKDTRNAAAEPPAFRVPVMSIGAALAIVKREWVDAAREEENPHEEDISALLALSSEEMVELPATGFDLGPLPVRALTPPLLSYLSVCLPACLSFCLSICLCTYLSISTSISISIYLPADRSNCASVHPSTPTVQRVFTASGEELIMDIQWYRQHGILLPEVMLPDADVGAVPDSAHVVSVDPVEGMVLVRWSTPYIVARLHPSPKVAAAAAEAKSRALAEGKDVVEAEAIAAAAAAAEKYNEVDAGGKEGKEGEGGERRDMIRRVAKAALAKAQEERAKVVAKGGTATSEVTVRWPENERERQRPTGRGLVFVWRDEEWLPAFELCADRGQRNNRLGDFTLRPGDIVAWDYQRFYSLVLKFGYPEEAFECLSEGGSSGITPAERAEGKRFQTAAQKSLAEGVPQLMRPGKFNVLLPGLRSEELCPGAGVQRDVPGDGRVGEVIAVNADGTALVHWAPYDWAAAAQALCFSERGNASYKERNRRACGLWSPHPDRLLAVEPTDERAHSSVHPTIFLRFITNDQCAGEGHEGDGGDYGKEEAGDLDADGVDEDMADEFFEALGSDVDDTAAAADDGGSGRGGDDDGDDDSDDDIAVPFPTVVEDNTGASGSVPGGLSRSQNGYDPEATESDLQAAVDGCLEEHLDGEGAGRAESQYKAALDALGKSEIAVMRIHEAAMAARGATTPGSSAAATTAEGGGASSAHGGGSSATQEESTRKESTGTRVLFTSAGNAAAAASPAFEIVSAPPTDHYYLFEGAGCGESSGGGGGGGATFDGKFVRRVQKEWKRLRNDLCGKPAKSKGSDKAKDQEKESDSKMEGGGSAAAAAAATSPTAIAKTISTTAAAATTTIYVQAFQSRMDLMRCLIAGPASTPYEDGAFFFDILLPPKYPSVPPKVHFHSHGERMNPNLYDSGKVCLSLLGTWTSGDATERWSPKRSSVLQVLLSIQALILVDHPYFNEPGYDVERGTAQGDLRSARYNEGVRLQTLGVGVLSAVESPPLGMSRTVAAHFTEERRQRIVDSCKRAQEQEC